MSAISKALRDELKRQGFANKHGRTYSSNSGGRRRVKIWGCPKKAFSGLDFVAKQLGAIECEMITNSSPIQHITSFVAWFPIGIDGSTVTKSQISIDDRQPDMFGSAVAETVWSLRHLLQHCEYPSNGTWNVVKGPYGHASIIIYDQHGNEVREIRNKV